MTAIDDAGDAFVLRDRQFLGHQVEVLHPRQIGIRPSCWCGWRGGIRWSVYGLRLGRVPPESREKVGSKRHVLVEEGGAAAEFPGCVIPQDRPDHRPFTKG